MSLLNILHFSTRFNKIVLLAYLSVVALLLGGASLYLRHKSALLAEKIYLEQSQQISKEVRTLIAQKKHATRVLALSLSKDPSILDALSTEDPDYADLAAITEDFRRNSAFKNVWIQLVTPGGRSLKRSWTPRRGDMLYNVRHDLRKVLLDPRIVNTISVGKFDMTFQTIIPIFLEGSFIGLLEVITHFNSIDRLLQQRGYRSIVLTDAAYRAQLYFPYTGKFIGDYYVANLDADEALMAQLEPRVHHITHSHEPYLIDGKWFFCVTAIPDVNNAPMGYYVVALPLQRLDRAAITKFEKQLYPATFLLFLLITLLFYRLLDQQKLPDKLASHRTVWRLIISFTLLYTAVITAFWVILTDQLQSRTTEHLDEITRSHRAFYRLAYSKYHDLADTLFHDLNRDEQAIALFARAAHDDNATLRRSLFATLQGRYERMRSLNVRQLHFHQKGNISYLRFHRPDKFGDDLTAVRDTVRLVNDTLKPVHGFEEGRIYHGYRFVYPLFSRANEHIGSVEISFSGSAILQEFEALGFSVNLLFSREVMREKVFEAEQSNYLESPLEGFMFDRGVMLRARGKFTESDYADASLRKAVTRRIAAAAPFAIHLPRSRRIDTYLPIENPATRRVVACLVVGQGDGVLDKLRLDFYFLLSAFAFLFFVISIFIFREMLGRHIVGNINAILDRKVTHDTLTGAYTREFFHSSFEAIYRHHLAQHRHTALILLDIDHFKRVNDTFGHATGDLVLRDLTALIRASFRQSDYLIRWGGEEFLILMPVDGIDNAVKAIEGIRETIAAHPFEHVGPVTCSFGVTLYREDESVQEALRRADVALYAAKEAGRHCVRIKA